MSLNLLNGLQYTLFPGHTWKIRVEIFQQCNFWAKITILMYYVEHWRFYRMRNASSTRQGPVWKIAGKHMYAAPEVINKSEVVNAFAINLWSTGVVLFVMLVGLAPPFQGVHATCNRYKRYVKISRGELKDLMDMFGNPIESRDVLHFARFFLE
jgi:hypothetical protein